MFYVVVVVVVVMVVVIVIGVEVIPECVRVLIDGVFKRC